MSRFGLRFGFAFQNGPKCAFCVLRFNNAKVVVVVVVVVVSVDVVVVVVVVAVCVCFDWF